MGQTLTHGIYLPDEGERNCYNGLAGNWSIIDGAVGTIAEHTTQIAGKANAVHTHTKSDITDLLNSNFIPSANNSYDLGSSSYQWNNLYAKNYFYNGTAWGLDKYNQWTSEQTCKSNNPKWINRNTNITMGVAPASNQTCAFYNYDKNGNEIGRLISRVQTDGKTVTWISATNLYKNGAIDPTGSFVWANLYCAVDANGYPHVSTDCALTPNVNNTYDLGNTTSKWKSFNGVNPGALSIFNPSASYDPIDIPTSWDTSGASWNTLSVSNLGDGWICITYNNCLAGGYILVRFGGTNGSRYPSLKFEAVKGSDNKYYIYALFPVAKAFSNIYLEMLINSNANLILHHYIPAYGTV